MTRFKRFLAPLAALMLLGGLMFVGFGWPLWAGKQSQVVDEPKGNNSEEKIEVKKIPLSEIYSTSDQRSLVPINRRITTLRKQLDDFNNSLRTGASNLFLVAADDVDGAVVATWNVFFRWEPIDRPAQVHPESQSKNLWFVAYLGISGSDPPEWIVRSVEVTGNKIRLSVVRGGAETDDVNPYFYWVPLGELEDKDFQLEWVDAETGAVELMRRVGIRER